MAIGKLYIGRKIRELRRECGNTQLEFAEKMGISVSYLNQIENNVRPVSAAILLALADKFQIDIASLSTGEEERLLAVFSEIILDPFFKSWRPSLQEIRLVAQNAPNLAHALIACYQAYRLAQEQLVEQEGAIGENFEIRLSPYEEVKDFFYFFDNYFHDLDQMAEHLSMKINLSKGDNYTTIAEYFERNHDILVRLEIKDYKFLYQYDSIDRVLYLNPYMALPTRQFQMAALLARFESADLIDHLIQKAALKSHEAKELCHMGLQNYFAAALLMPYSLFLQKTKEFRHDIHLLAMSFGVSLEQVCHRLSSLQRSGCRGVPVFFARVDLAGNITKKHSSTKLQFPRFGNSCPIWNVHQAFCTPGRVIRQLIETPDQEQYFCIAIEPVKYMGGIYDEAPRYALALGCEIADAHHFVYADNLDLSNQSAYAPIGSSCRNCSRIHCSHRVVSSVYHNLVIDRDQRGGMPYRFTRK